MRTRPYQSLGQIVSSKLLKTKNSENNKMTADVVVGFAVTRLESPWVKLLTQSAPRRIRPSPWRFLSQKGLNCRPRTGFCKVTTLQSRPPPQSRTSKGGESVKRISYLPSSPYITSADFSLCSRAESEPADVLLSQDSSETGWDEVVQTVTKDEFILRQQMERCKKYV
jgi:hypothetical protein